MQFNFANCKVLSYVCVCRFWDWISCTFSVKFEEGCNIHYYVTMIHKSHLCLYLSFQTLLHMVFFSFLVLSIPSKLQNIPKFFKACIILNFREWVIALFQLYFFNLFFLYLFPHVVYFYDDTGVRRMFRYIQYKFGLVILGHWNSLRLGVYQNAFQNITVLINYCHEENERVVSLLKVSNQCFNGLETVYLLEPWVSFS